MTRYPDAIPMQSRDQIPSGLDAALRSALYPSLSDFSNENPMYVTHRNNALRWPEGSLEGIKLSFDRGLGSIQELDCRLLGDGEIAVLHDDTMDRTSAATGAATSYTTTTYLAAGLDSSAWFGGPDTTPALLYDALIYMRDRAVLLLDAATSSAVKPTVDMAIALGLDPVRTMITSDRISDIVYPHAAGYPFVLTVNTGGDQTAKIASSLAAGMVPGTDWVNLSFGDLDSAAIAQWVASGIRVCVYTLDRRWQRDQVLALGVQAIYSDDVEYLRSDKPLLQKDKFYNGEWPPGFVAGTGDLAEDNRGRITGGKLSFSSTAANNRFVLLGGFCPIRSTSYDVYFDVKWNGVNGGDTTRWAAIFIAGAAVKDRRYNNELTDPTLVGYRAKVLMDGGLVLYRCNGTTETTLDTRTGTAISVGGTALYKLSVRPTSLVLSRLNADGGVMGSAAASSDVTPGYRGEYLHVGRNGAAVALGVRVSQN